MVIDISNQDTRPVVLWMIVAAIGVHIIEEYAFNFPGWTVRFFSIPITSEDFHLVNACVSLYAIAGAVVGWRLPAFSLSTAGLIGLNGLFHAGASVVVGGYSPGAVTGALVFVPLAAIAYQTAARAGVLSSRVFLISLAGGVFWHAYLGVVFYLKYIAPVYP